MGQFSPTGTRADYKLTGRGRAWHYVDRSGECNDQSEMTSLAFTGGAWKQDLPADLFWASRAP